MGRLFSTCVGFAAVCVTIALPAFADTRFDIRQMNRNDMPPGRGVCEIRLQVDNEVEITVDANRVFIHTLSGQDARDDGSICNMAMPRGDVQGFSFDVMEKRGDIQLVEGPSRRNGNKVIVRVRDSSGGFGRYIFRISWAMDGYRQPPPPPPDRRQDDRRPDDRRPDDRRPDGYDQRADLRIINAVWGVPGRSREVTRLLQDRIRDGRLRMHVTNEDIGFDPAVGTPKALTVIYELRGRRQEIRIPEGDNLELP